jgi:16S rRNA (guanine527-N7)-methyltransferase
VQALLEKYLDELERWNPRFGLVKFSDRRELVVKHVCDSLAGWKAVRDAVEGRGGPLNGSGGPAARPPGGSVLDVGSGAGFPGIPLAAAMPDASFTLLERMSRRASFLRTCTVLLGLPLLRVIQADLAEVSGDFDLVTCRAVAPVERFLSDIERSGVRWRTAIAYKGRTDRARSEIEAARRSLGEGWDFQLVPLQPPFLAEERCLIVATRNRLLTNH